MWKKVEFRGRWFWLWNIKKLIFWYQKLKKGFLFLKLTLTVAKRFISFLEFQRSFHHHHLLIITIKALYNSMLKSLKLLNDHRTTIKCKAKWKIIFFFVLKFFSTRHPQIIKKMEQNKTLCEYVRKKR